MSTKAITPPTCCTTPWRDPGCQIDNPPRGMRASRGVVYALLHWEEHNHQGQDLIQTFQKSAPGEGGGGPLACVRVALTRGGWVVLEGRMGDVEGGFVRLGQKSSNFTVKPKIIYRLSVFSMVLITSHIRILFQVKSVSSWPHLFSTSLFRLFTSWTGLSCVQHPLEL